MEPRFSPKPPWLKVRAPGGETYGRLKQTFRKLDLYTVCEEARCPNVGECWREGTATVMLLGDVCTRGCRFCAVTTGDPRGVVDSREPEHVARAIAQLELVYVVLTMVNRDDLLDGGADHVGRTVRRLHERRPDLLVETLVGDFRGHMDDVDAVCAAGPDVFAHNVEVVRRITRKIRDARSSYEQSLRVLERAKERFVTLTQETGKPHLTKSSLMVGIGETDDEVFESLADLRGAGVDVVTIGQYLRPSERHAPVDRFVHPDTFAAYEKAARELGFLYAASGPLVRSSYRAAEVFLRSVLGSQEPHRLGEGGAVHHDVSPLLEERLARARVLAQAETEAAGGVADGTDGPSRERALLPVSALLRRPSDAAPGS
jgi:lipoic acid synthetase